MVQNGGAAIRSDRELKTDRRMLCYWYRLQVMFCRLQVMFCRNRFADMLLEPTASKHHVERGSRADDMHNSMSTRVFSHVPRSGERR